MATTFKCECGKEFEKQGQLNLHKYHCTLKKAAKKNDLDLNHEKCDHQFRLLNPRVQSEYNAMQSGHGEVCAKCLNLQ